VQVIGNLLVGGGNGPTFVNFRSFHDVVQQAIIQLVKGNLIDGLDQFIHALIISLHDKILPTFIPHHPLVKALLRKCENHGVFLCNRPDFTLLVPHTAGKSHGTAFSPAEVIEEKLGPIV
jgi:hypothetical protein